MKLLFATALAVSALAATAAFAQTPAPSTAPAGKIEVTPPLSPSAASPSAPAAPSASTAQVGPASTTAMVMSDEQAKAWVNKVVYSSDDKNLGEVAALARDSSGKVSELHADIGGFLGLGETRVRVMPADFKLMTDKVVLNITADAAKTLPQIAK